MGSATMPSCRLAGTIFWGYIPLGFSGSRLFYRSLILLFLSLRFRCGGCSQVGWKELVGRRLGMEGWDGRHCGVIRFPLLLPSYRIVVDMHSHEIIIVFF